MWTSATKCADHVQIVAKTNLLDDRRGLVSEETVVLRRWESDTPFVRANPWIRSDEGLTLETSAFLDDNLI